MSEYKDKTVITKDGKQAGYASGSFYRCRMEGCNGHRVATKWPDGKTTFPCTKGMKFLPTGDMQLM
jgi:hypothetical protein